MSSMLAVSSPRHAARTYAQLTPGKQALQCLRDRRPFRCTGGMNMYAMDERAPVLIPNRSAALRGGVLKLRQI